MIFKSKSRKILREWVLDFESAPAQPTDNTLIPSLKKAISKRDCKTTFVSSIATLANSNISTVGMPPDIINESIIILADIASYYDVTYEGDFTIIAKKDIK